MASESDSSKQQWSGASYLDALRPDLGWHVEHAILTSYSADLSAVVAAMLALAGLDDDRGSGSKVDFANAIDRLTGKFRLVVQAGRLLAPRKAPKILGLLDQFIREVPFDEQLRSWHPKIALVKTRRDHGDDVEWRLWIGSRNLTRDMSWDVGLTLVGHPDGDGQQIDGISDLAKSLASRAEMEQLSSETLAEDLASVRWLCPSGCDVASIRLHDSNSPRSLPEPSAGLNRLWVISPFLDQPTVKKLSTWGDSGTKRTLLTSKTELLKLAGQSRKPLVGFRELLAMASPDPDEVTSAMGTDSEQASEDEEPELRGLHAKIIIAEHDSGTTMWTGSANATKRGWSGPNSEVILEASISEDVLAGLLAFVSEFATTIQDSDLDEPHVTDELQDRLDRARAQVAARWNVSQAINDSIPILTADADPNPIDSEIKLQVATLCGTWTDWPRGRTQVQLPLVPPSDVTELVMCKISLGDLTTSWLQCAPLNPPPDAERNRQALAKYLDPKTFLQSVRSLLVGTPPGDGGGSWDGSRTHAKHLKTHGPAWWAPTIEEILKSWSRDPSSLREVNDKVKYYLDLYQKREDSEITDEERKVVSEFEQVWAVISAELVSKR